MLSVGKYANSALLVNVDVDDYFNNTYYLPSNVSHEKDFLNLKIENLRIGIGCYYLDRSIEMKDIEKIDTSNLIISPIVDNIETKHINMTKVGNGTLSYPQFAAKMKYLTKDGEEKVIIDKYILTNVYDNSMDLINIYTDMSNFVKSSVQIHEIDKNENESLEMIHFTDIPVIQFSQCLSDTIADRITNIISDTNENLSDLSMQITNSFIICFNKPILFDSTMFNFFSSLSKFPSKSWILECISNLHSIAASQNTLNVL